jgi:hypothetical protein
VARGTISSRGHIAYPMLLEREIREVLRGGLKVPDQVRDRTKGISFLSPRALAGQSKPT